MWTEQALLMCLLPSRFLASIYLQPAELSPVPAGGLLTMNITESFSTQQNTPWGGAWLGSPGNKRNVQLKHQADIEGKGIITMELECLVFCLLYVI